MLSPSYIYIRAEFWKPGFGRRCCTYGLFRFLPSKLSVWTFVYLSLCSIQIYLCFFKWALLGGYCPPMWPHMTLKRMWYDKDETGFGLACSATRVRTLALKKTFQVWCGACKAILVYAWRSAFSRTCQRRNHALVAKQRSCEEHWKMLT